jgi:hypothetical protein
MLESHTWLQILSFHGGIHCVVGFMRCFEGTRFRHLSAACLTPQMSWYNGTDRCRQTSVTVKSRLASDLQLQCNAIHRMWMYRRIQQQAGVVWPTLESRKSPESIKKGNFSQMHETHVDCFQWRASQSISRDDYSCSSQTTIARFETLPG